MADDIDRANDQVQMTLDSALRTMRKNSGEPPKNLTGKCAETPILRLITNGTDSHA